MKTFSLALTALAVGLTVGAGARVATQVQSRQAGVVPVDAQAGGVVLSRRAPAGALRLVGEIDGPQAGGTVTVYANGRVVGEAPVSATNTWAVDVAGIGASEMITAEWQAPSIHFTATVGGFAGLRTRAGTDAVLTLGESDTLRISALSTSLDFFAARLLGGAARSDTQYESVLRTVETSDLHGVAVGLQRTADDTSRLPAGFANGLAFARSEGGVRALTLATNESDGNLVVAAWKANPTSTAILGEGIVLLGAVSDIDRPLDMFRAAVIEPSGDDFTVFSDVPGDPLFTGARVDGTLVLTPRTPARSTTQRGWCASTGSPFEQVTEHLESRYDRMRTGQRVSIWRLTHVQRVSFPDCPEMTPYALASSAVNPAIALSRTMPMPGGRRPFAGLKSLPAFCVQSAEPQLPGALQICDYAPHRFDANGQGSQRELGDKIALDTMAPQAATGERAFTWVRPTQGTLHVDTPEVSARYWLIDLGVPGVTGWAYAATANVGGTLEGIGGYTAMLSSDAGTPAVSMVGTWTHSDEALYPVSEAYPVTPDPRTRRTIFAADGKLVRQSVDMVGRWSPTLGRIYDTRVRATGSAGSSYHDCEEATAALAAACTPWHVRAFRPMLVQGDWVYGVQDSYQNSVPPGFYLPIEWYRTATRPVAYRREAMRR